MSDRPRETEEERAARKERERRERPRETEEERAARKERERRERPKETEEERAARKERERKERERGDRPKETEEERAARKERERRERERGERPKETEEERAARKERERKERERGDRPKETEEERAARKERERKERERGERPKETEEERAARKERERKEREHGERPKETEEERAARKERERKEREHGERPKETEEERAARKERERKERERGGRETDEERAARKERERREREEKERERAKREVVHKPLPAARGSDQATPTTKASPTTSKPVVAVAPRPEPAPKEDGEEEEDDDYGYDDDFEEAFSPEELQKVQQAVSKENTALRAQPAAAQPKEPEIKGSTRAGLDVNSLQRQKAKAQFEKDIARAEALRRLVDLDELSATIVDLPPMSEYDMFIRNFGGTGRQQTAVQAPPEADRIDVESQAERIHSKVKACQCPEDLGLFPERSRPMDAEGKPTRQTVDTAALGSFLTRVFPVVRTLMDDNEAIRNPLTRKSSFSNHGFSSTVVPLLFEPASDRPVVEVTFSRLATQYMLVVYGPPRVPDNKNLLDEYQGLALLWNINDVREPEKIFVSYAELTGGCLSASRQYLVYAGTACGSVCVWDTREPDHQHSHVLSKGTSVRLPSFSSEWGKENHSAPIVRVQIAGYNSIMGVRKEETEQLASLDRRGNLYFWRVSEGDSVATQHTISEADYGLNLFSTVRLHRASIVKLQAEKDSAGHIAQDLEFVPSDTSHLVVATATSLQHLSRFGSIAAPSSYRAQSQWGSYTTATSLHYSPTDSRVLCSGFKDGSVRLFLKDDPTPQVSVTISTAEIRRVRCSSSMKWIVFALDSTGSFSVIDFAVNNKGTPVGKSDLQEAKAGRCTSFDVSLEEKAESRIGIGYERGLVEVHTLNNKIFAPPNQRNDRWL